MRLLYLLLCVLISALQSEGEVVLAKWLLRSHSNSPQASNSGLRQCPEIPSDMTFCSGAMHRRESIQEANIWISLLNSQCHPKLTKFICSIYNPVCLQSHQVMPIQPCRQLCRQVHTACISRMYLFGFTWPEHTNCDLFPSEEDSMCISAERETVTCPPCEQLATKANIIKKYCTADVVLKSPISRVTVFKNTSSLIINLDKISERFQPEPKVSEARYVVEEVAPSPGFLDTNLFDEEVGGSIGPNSPRRRGAFAHPDQSSPVKQMTVGKETRISQPEKPQADDLLMPIAPTTKTSLQNNNAVQGRRRRNQRQDKRRRGRQNHEQLFRRRRDRRSSTDYDGPFDRMLLECAGCSLDLPTSPMTSNAASRWLIMGRRINVTSKSEPGAPTLQVTAIFQWSKTSVGLKDALRDIRTIPREILCDPNSKVQMPFGNTQHSNSIQFFNNELLAAYRPGSENRYNWKRNPSLNQPTRSNGGYQWPSQQGWPYSFDRLFQNDAVLANSNSARRDTHKLERRRQRKQASMLNSKEQPSKDNSMQGFQQPQKQQAQNNDPLSREKRRKQRRQRIKEKLASMSPEERKKWRMARKARRALRKQRKRQDQQQARNPQETPSKPLTVQQSGTFREARKLTPTGSYPYLPRQPYSPHIQLPSNKSSFIT